MKNQLREPKDSYFRQGKYIVIEKEEGKVLTIVKISIVLKLNLLVASWLSNNFTILVSHLTDKRKKKAIGCHFQWIKVLYSYLFLVVERN